MKTTLDELQTFIAVVDSGAISRAAEQLGLTVSGASRTLARLEEKLSTTLLRRTTRRLELTEEGRAFLLRARQIIASVEDAEEHMAARQERPSGRLRVDAATPFMLHAVVPAVAGRLSSAASGLTATTAVAAAQLVGNAVSHTW